MSKSRERNGCKFHMGNDRTKYFLVRMCHILSPNKRKGLVPLKQTKAQTLIQPWTDVQVATCKENVFKRDEVRHIKGDSAKQ